MPIAAPIATLAGSIIGGVVSTHGTNVQQSQNDAALRAQIDYNNRALQAAQEQQAWERNFQQQQFGLSQNQFDYQKQLNDRLIGNQLERQNYQRGQYSQYLNRLSPYSTAPQESLGTLNTLLRPNAIGLGGGGGGATVQMRAPDGTVAAVSPDQVDHYTSLGATRVG